MAQVQGSREQVLIAAYNAGYEFVSRYKNDYKTFIDAYNQRYEREKTAMQILGFTPVGWVYYLGKGLYNGAVGFTEGAGVLISNLLNNAAQTFLVNENEFLSEDWFKEFGSDLLYMASSGFMDAFQGLANGALDFAGNLGNVVGISPEWTEKASSFIAKATTNAKTQILNPETWGKNWTGVSPDMRTPEDYTFDITGDAIEGIDKMMSKAYYKGDIFAPYMQDTPVSKKAHEILAGTLESIGRMIPSIAITALSGGSVVGALASSGYFYATTYGQSFNEALQKGVSIADAHLYATQVAGIETLTEQIGGFTFGAGIGSNLLENMVNEGIEEVVAELATSGTKFDEQGTPIYENPKDLMERVLTAGFTGALSGGIMTGGNIWYKTSKQGTAYSYIDQISDGLKMEVSKNGFQTTQDFVTKSLEDGLESMNKAVANPKNLEKTRKTLEQSQASAAIEFDEKSNKFVLTEFGEQIKTDIRARQGKNVIGDNYVAYVAPLMSVEEKYKGTKDINGVEKKFTSKINIIEKNNSKYIKNKNWVDKTIDFAKNLGMSIVFYDDTTKNGQGFYTNGISYVNINNIGENGAGLLRQVAGHELLHKKAALYKGGLLSEKATKHFKKLELLIKEMAENDPDFTSRVAKAIGITKNSTKEEIASKEQLFAEERMTYFIEDYIKMGKVMERFAWNHPSILRKMVEAITGIRIGGTMSVIEEEYMALLKEVSLQTYDSISGVLALSMLSPETAKASKIIERKMYNKKTNQYSYLVDFLIKVDKDGNYILPEALKEKFGDASDKDAKSHEDFKKFLIALTNKDVNALIDNFLDTAKIADEVMQKRLTGLKAATLFGYMEENKYFRHNEVMKPFKERFIAEINKRLEEEKEKLKDKPLEDGNLIRVNAKTFHRVFALNYIKIFQENYVSLYPVSVYEKVKYLYLRNDLMAGFAVQGEEQDNNATLGRFELASLFKSAGDISWLKSKVNFITNELGARQLASVSETVALIYKDVFNESIQIVKAKGPSMELIKMQYDNFYMAMDWTATYSNYIITELARRHQNPTYTYAAATGLRENLFTPETKYSVQKNVSTDSEGNELTPQQLAFFKNSKFRDEEGNLKVLYHGSNFAGFMEFIDKDPIFLTDDYEHAATYTRGTDTVFTRKFNSYIELRDFLYGGEFYELFPNYDPSEMAPSLFKLSNDLSTERGRDDQYHADELLEEYKMFAERNYDSQMVKTLNEVLGLIKKDGYISRFDYEINGKHAVRFHYYPDEESLVQEFMPNLQEDHNKLLNKYDEDNEETNLGTNIYRVFVNVTNPLIVDGDFRHFGRIPFRNSVMNTDEISKLVKSEGVYDGIIFKNIKDNGYRDAFDEVGYGDVYVAFNANQIKAADNEKPTKNNDDIRYSQMSSVTQDSLGNNLTEDQQKYFADVHPLIKTDDGKLLVLYHGTMEDFNTFDKDLSGGVFFFTNEETNALSYTDWSPAKTLKKVYLRITKPYIVVVNGSWDSIDTGETTTIYYSSWKNVREALLEGKINTLGQLKSIVFANDPFNGFQELLWQINDEISAGKTESEITEKLLSKEEAKSLVDFYDSEFDLSPDRIIAFDEVIQFAYDSTGKDIDYKTTRDIVEKVKSENERLPEGEKYDGIIFQNIVDYGTNMPTQAKKPSTVFAVFEPNQIKSINNKTPTEDPDIRYSVQKHATRTQSDFFKNTVVKDLNGSVLPMYQVNDFSDIRPKYFGVKNAGAILSGYFVLVNNEKAKSLKNLSATVFVNITKPVDDQAMMSPDMFEKIVKNAKEINSLSQETIAKYRDMVKTGTLTNFIKVVDLMSYSLATFEDLYNFKKAINASTGYDGYVFRNEQTSEIEGAVAWFDNQIKHVGNLALDESEKDVILFSRYRLEDQNEEEVEEKVGHDLKGLLDYSYFEPVEDKNLVNEGYFLKSSGLPFYINERHLKIPDPFIIERVKYNDSNNEFVLQLVDRNNGKVLFYLAPQDYIHPTTGEVFKNARYLSYGTSHFGLEQLLTPSGSVSQSIALEDLSVFSPQSLYYTKDERAHTPSIFVLLKNNVLNKAGTIIGSVDYYTKVRKYYDDKVILFESSNGNNDTEVLRERVRAEAFKAIEENGGIISSEIENKYAIYNKNDPNLDVKVNEAINKHLYHQMISYIDNSINISSLIIRVKILYIFRDLVFFGKTSLSSVSDTQRKADFLWKVDSFSKSFDMLHSIYKDAGTMAKAVFEATDETRAEWKMKKFLSTMPYNYPIYGMVGDETSYEVREGKANVSIQDVGVVFYKSGNREKFIQENPNASIFEFDEVSQKNEKSLKALEEKGTKIVRLSEDASISSEIIKAANDKTIDPNEYFFSKKSIAEDLYDKDLVGKISNSTMGNIMFSRTTVPVTHGNVPSALNNLNSQKVDTFVRQNYERIEGAYAHFLETYTPKKATTADKTIAKIVENIDDRIRNNDHKKQLYNHSYISVAKFLVLQLNMLNTGTATTNFDREIMVSGLNSVIANTMSYLDTVFTNNDVNKLDPHNTKGHQYTKLIHWGIRNVLDTNDHTHAGVAELTSLYEAIFDLDMTSKTSLEGFYDALQNFEESTNVEQVNSCATDSAGGYAHTIPRVKHQADLWIDFMVSMVGRLLPNTNGSHRKIERTGGLLGDNALIDHLDLAKWLADPFTYAEVSSLFMKNGLPQVIQNRLFEGSKKQLQVLNAFTNYFENGGWLKKNRKKIDALEKNYVVLNNLADAGGRPVNMAMSQVITFYHNLKREIIRNRLIDAEFMVGEKTNHFAVGNQVRITENVSGKIEREAKGRDGTIVDAVGLFNELSTLMESADPFVLEYSHKIMGFFEQMHPYVNASFKDINGLELPNDAVSVREALGNLTDEEKEDILDGLPENEDYSQIYIPFRNAGQSHMNKGDFDVDNILDLGIFDGITQALKGGSNSVLLIDSINNLLPTYAKEVANYYGLYRIATDLNELFGSVKKIDGTEQRTTLSQKMDNYSKDVLIYYEELLKDISGYAAQKDSVSQKADKMLATLRKNFFRASLALNVKVIATQFASMITCGQMFGTGNNPFTNAGFMAAFTKNLFMAGSKTKAKYLVDNSEIYKNRAKMSTYEVSEATESAWTKNPVENAVEFFMRGITVTDNMINRALFITLKETINPKTGALYTEQQAMEAVEQAIERYQSSGDAISRSELLRTENQVLRLFTKFLGEPMKMLTNFYGVSKKLRVIKFFEKNGSQIQQYIKDKKAEADEALVNARRALIARLEYTNTPDFALLTTKEQRQYELATQKEEAKVNALEYATEESKRMYDTFGSNITEVIKSKTETKQKLGRLVSAFAGSLMWQVALGMIFKMLRGAGKDKPEDEETWKYLSKMFGHQLGMEFVGYFPFLRDVYSLVINGYSANEIDELQALNDLGLQMTYLITDIENGGDFNAWRHIRQFSLTLGAALGIPTRNIERLFTTPMGWFSASGTFTYKSATGQRVDVNQELKTAIETQDEKLLEAIIAQKLDDRNVKLGQDVVDEIERLASVNGESISIAGDYGKFTIEDKEYVLTREQQETFTEIYSRADYIASKIIKSEEYKKLNDEYKAKFLTSVFNYFYKMAKQVISGKKLIAEKNYFDNLGEAYSYFASAVGKRLFNTMINEQEKKEKGEE